MSTQIYRGHDPNRVITHPDAAKWLPVLVAIVESRDSWRVRCPDCGRPNVHGPEVGFRAAHCHCEGMMERRFMNGYVIAPPDAQLAPYPDFCRDCGQRMTLYTPVDLRPAPSNNGIIARYACDRSHGWETFWGDLPYGPPVVRPAPKPGSPRCALYRHYDDEGILLYVGISEKPLGRGKAHAKESVWVAFAARIEAEWLPDRATAETAERNAIRAEKPIFNKVHALVDANARIADYLASRGA